MVCSRTCTRSLMTWLDERKCSVCYFTNVWSSEVAEERVLATAEPGTPLPLKFSHDVDDNSEDKTRSTLMKKKLIMEESFMLQERLRLMQFAKELELELHCKLRLEQQTEEKKGLEQELICCKSQLEQQAKEKKKLQEELECSKLQIKHYKSQIEQQAQENKILQLELECNKLQLERQAHQMQAQEDRLFKIELIMNDTDKILASLPSRPTENRSIKYDQPKERGPCYWIFHKFQSGIKNAFMTSLVELAHQLAREKVISADMEKYIENETIPYEQRADELIKAVQHALDGNPENFRKVIEVLKMSKNSVCKKLSDRLACDYQLSNAVDLHMN